MDRKRVVIGIEVDLDPVPGEFHTQESAERNIEAILRGAIPHYNPKVFTGLPPSAMPPEAVAAMQRVLAGGPLGLLSALQEMLQNPDLMASMTEVTDTLRMQLPGEDEPPVPDYPPCAEGNHVNDDNPGRPICKTCDDDPNVSALYPQGEK